MQSNSFHESLLRIKNDYLYQILSIPIHINICAGTGCIANGALKVYDEFQKQLANSNINVVLTMSEGHHKHPENSALLMKSGCHGFCQMGSLVEISPMDVLYTKVKPEDVSRIIEKTIKNRTIIDDLLYINNIGEIFEKSSDIPFYSLQTRNTLEKCGAIDATDIKAYIAQDGYLSATNTFTQMIPQDVINIITRSGLRGRGGAGFPTGKK